jgi:hypothetical protein
MEYKGEDGKLYTISYSQRLQMALVVIGTGITLLLIIIMIILFFILTTNLPSQVMSKLVC